MPGARRRDGVVSHLVLQQPPLIKNCSRRFETDENDDDIQIRYLTFIPYCGRQLFRNAQ